MCETDFASYADNNTHYVSGDSADDIIKSLEDDYINFFKWFLDNQIKGNSSKCHFVTSKQSCMNLKIGNINTENSTCEKLLVVKEDNKLNFNEHLNEIIKKATRKVSSLCRIFLFFGLKEKTLFNKLILHFTIKLLSYYLDVS